MRTMRTALPAAILLVLGLAACPGDGGGDGGFELPGGEPDADDTSGEPDADDTGGGPDADDTGVDPDGGGDTGGAVGDPCAIDDDCGAAGDGCCTVGVCGDDDTCEASTLEGCCAVDDDCDDGDDGTMDACANACEVNGCNHEAAGDGNPGAPCAGDGDCDGDGYGCCETGVCGGDDTCEAADLANCCEADADCDDDNADTTDTCADACEADGCSFKTEGGDPGDDCGSDADCDGDGYGCCEEGVCGGGGKCEASAITGCCESSGDCNDGDPDTTDLCSDSCTANGCTHVEIACADAKTLTKKNFDDGTLQLLKPSDADTGDDVGIQAVKTAAVSPDYALYLGNADCETYYTGALKADCTPVDGTLSDSSAVLLEVSTVNIPLVDDAGGLVTFWVKMAAEPALVIDLGDGNGEQTFPTDWLQVSADNGTDKAIVWMSTDADALGGDNTTNGGWRHMAADLTAFAGTQTEVTFHFVSDDLNNFSVDEPWIGVYLDNIAVGTTCDEAHCDGAGAACPDDANACSANTCTAFSDGSGGICAYHLDTPGETCAPCAQPSDCGSDPCESYACGAGKCSIDAVAGCCLPSSSFPAVTDPPVVAIEGFEAADIGDWMIDDAYPDDNVGWQVDDALAAAGMYSLYFGDPDTYTFVAEPLNPAIATIWTPAFPVPGDMERTPAASFWLWMETEFDDLAELPNPDAPFDSLTIWVRPAGEDMGALVWDSVSTLGNTTEGAFVQIGVDLSDWRGEDVELGFMFDSGEIAGTGANNDYGGVRIDELTVTSICGATPCISFGDCDDGDPCTNDYCDLGECAFVQGDPLCCYEDADCDLGNECTTFGCVDNQCEWDYDAGTVATCCSEGPWIGEYMATFDEGDDGFTAMNMTPPVSWYVSDVDGAGVGGSFNFGNSVTGTYEVPGGGAAQGSLVSAPIMVPPQAMGQPYAEFSLLLETEWDVANPDDFDPLFIVDELQVKIAIGGVLEDAEPVWFSHYLTNTSGGEWVSSRVDLADYRGEVVQLVFFFDSGDGDNNAFAGPFIDDVSFGSSCLPSASIQCIYGGDCSPLDDCHTVACTEGFKCLQSTKDTPECCEPQVVPDMTYDFEGDDDDGWTFETCTPSAADGDPAATWHAANQGGAAGIPPKAGSKSLYFGNGSDYGGDLGACGQAWSPEVTLSDVPWTVDYWVYLDIEPASPCEGAGAVFSDIFQIELIDVADGTSELVFEKGQLLCNQYDGWVKQSLDLSEYAGRTIQLHLTFDTGDDIENDGKGLALDVFEFTQGCAEEF